MLEENGEDKIVKVANEQVPKRIGEKRTLLNNILRRKANWIRHKMRANQLLCDVTDLIFSSSVSSSFPLTQSPKVSGLIFSNDLNSIS